MKMKLSLALSALLLGSTAFAVDGDGLALEFTNPETLSNGGLVNSDGAAFKTKLVQLGNGMLITTFGEGIGPDVYDVKGDNVRKARDIFVRTCMPTDLNGQCATQDVWSPAINISNTANNSSIATRWAETNGVLNPTPAPFYGDSGKPNIFNAGTFAVVSWTDKYCEGGEQRMISYNERGGITVPFQCVYAAHIDYSKLTPTAWVTEQITTGHRDAMQDVNKGVSIKKADGTYLPQWIISWQEDPHGLQLGSGDGPGDGASGANVTHGTDIWYTWAWNLNYGFKKPRVRISNNYTSDGAGGNTSPVYHPSDPTTEITELERGNTGASRANSALVNVANEEWPNATPRVMMAYEETKGADRLDNGKFVRYHNFKFNEPPVSTGEYANGEPGYIISDPAENGRRVRFVTQVTAGENGLRMGIFWRQGNAVEGGPGDIMARLGFKPESTDAWKTGFRPEDMVPAVDPNADAIDYTAATLINNTPASNISSNTIPWAPLDPLGLTPDLEPSNNLTDTTDLNMYEDARAHRAAIRGSDFYIGYTYARDWAVATFTNMDNYNFWFRRYDSVTGQWTVASNISKIDRLDKLHVKEPRLVGMPGNRAGCLTPSIPESITNPENCQNKSAVLLAWGTETNVYSHIGGSVEGDIVYTISKDKGETYLPLAKVPGYLGTELMSRFESQLRSTPAGNIVYSVWNEENRAADGSFSQLSVSDNRVPAEPEPVVVP